MHGKTEPAVRGANRTTATKEQLRIAQATQDIPDEDRSRIQKMIKEIIETTRCSQSQAEIALHDASNNVEVAVNNILESSNLDSWSHYKRKGPKSKEEERDEFVKKGGNRPPRRGNQPRDKGMRNAENGNESRENRQPREKEDGGFRGGNRNSQPRSRREPGAKREGKKANHHVEGNDENDDHWKNGPLVFNRRDNIEEKEQLQNEASKVTSKPTNTGSLSFADVVRRNAQKSQPAEADAQYKLRVSNNSKQVSSGLVESNENTAFSSILPETSKSPRQLGHHLDIEGALLHEDQSSFGAQSSSQKMHQSLTEQLKTDLGLGTTPNSFGNSKKFHEPLHQNKAVKAGVVEFLSGDAPAISSGEWQFGFDATPLPQSSVSDDHQFRRDNVSKMNEPARNDIGLTSSNINDSNSSRGNASTVLNQYVQQPSSQYGAANNSHQQPFNRNRNNGVNNLPFANNYSDNFNAPDLRSSYGAASPPKPQSVQQSLQNLVSQQLPSQQQTHHQQHPIFPSYPNYPYMNMYSPVAPGLRDDFGGPILPFQYNINQSGLDLMMLPQLNATSAPGPLATNHQGHQNPQQNVQQGLQHSQSSHSAQQQNRNEHYSDMKFLANQMSIPPASQQNSSANGHNAQQNSNLGNNQRQQLLDNNSQASVPPPPGFGNLGPNFMRNMPFQQQFQAPVFANFPYSVMPQHKSK